MRAHEEAEWTGIAGVNPELLTQLGDLADVAVHMLRCVPDRHRKAVLDTLIESIQEGVGAIGASKH